METTGPHHGAKVALFLGTKLIAILRDDRPDITFPNLWDLPGGGREGDETTFETVAREVHEELGLILPIQSVLWECAFPAMAHDREWVSFFVAQMPEQTVNSVQFGDEGQRWQLFDMPDFVQRTDRVPSYGQRLAKWVEETGGLPGVTQISPS